MKEERRKYIPISLTIIFGWLSIGIGIYVIIARIIPQPWNYGYDAYLRGIFLLISGVLLLGISLSLKDITSEYFPPSYTSYLTIFSALFGILLVLSEILLELSVGNDWAHFQFICLFPIQGFFVLLSLVHVFTLIRHSPLKSFLPILVNLIFILAFNYSTNYVPETNIGFKWKLDDYEEVIYLVNNNSVKLNNDGFGELPDEYKYLSDGGRIWVERRGELLYVMFFEHTGILGEYRGTVFSPDGTPPTDHDSYICDILTQIQEDNPYWYECIST